MKRRAVKEHNNNTQVEITNNADNDIKRENKKLFFLLIFGSILGIVFAFISLYEHVELKNDLKINPSFCNISATFNCDKVNESKYAEILGIPIASYGLMYYIVILGYSIYFLRSKELRKEVFANVCLVFTTGAMLFSVYLFCVSAFAIKTFCLNCSFMYLANILQWLASLWLDRNTKIYKRLIDGVMSLISFPFIILGVSGKITHPLRAHAFLSSLIGVGLAAFILFMPNNILLPKIRKDYLSHQNYRNHNKEFYEWFNESEQEIALNAARNLDGVYYEGNRNAPIKIVEYADLQCPACRSYYNSSKEFLKKYKGKILFVYKHFPLDNQCNSMIKHEGHKYACYASLFSLCAGEQGKYWGAMDRIMVMPSLTENKGDIAVQKEFRETINELGLDKIAFNECMESKRYYNKISSDVEEAKALNITGTPFVFINGKQLKNRSEFVMQEIFNYILSNH